MQSQWTVLEALNTGPWYLPARDLIGASSVLGFLASDPDDSLLTSIFYLKIVLDLQKCCKKILHSENLSPRFPIVNILLNFLPLILIYVGFYWHDAPSPLNTTMSTSPKEWQSPTYIYTYIYNHRCITSVSSLHASPSPRFSVLGGQTCALSPFLSHFLGVNISMLGR